MLTHVLLSTLLAVPALAASANDWRSRSIYQLVTDRFATPDGSSPTCNTSDRKYCGGTWKGITSKLDYIQNMGFDAIWISPVVANVEGTTAYGEAFHGYWTQNINALNSHFGSADDLKALASALHSRKMYLMLDVVVNHMAGTSNPPNYASFEPFNIQSDFHSECFIQPTDYDHNQTAVEQCWLGDSSMPLADVNTEDQAIVSTFNTWIAGLVGNYSVDGVRIDTVKHVRQDFWPGFAKSAGVYTIGEVLDNSTSYVGPYTQVLDAVLDYPAWFELTPGFVTPQGNLSALAEVVKSAQGAYKNGEFFTGSFLENHDQPRFQSQTQDQALVKNAMTWPFIHDGVPILYYGQEQGYAGGADPANREALWLSGYTEDKPLVTHVKSLNAARKAAAAANSNFYTTGMKFLVETPSTLAISKPPLLALLTNVGSNSTTGPKWDVPNAGFSANQALVDVVGCAKMNADASGGVSVQGSGGMPMVLMPVSDAGSLCGGKGGSGQANGGERVSGGVWGRMTVGGVVAAGLAFVGALV